MDKVITIKVLTTEFGDRVQRVYYSCGCMSESDLDANDEKIGTGCFYYCSTCFYGSGYDDDNNYIVNTYSPRCGCGRALYANDLALMMCQACAEFKYRDDCDVPYPDENF